jgi:putative DNA primase/helicase
MEVSEKDRIFQEQFELARIKARERLEAEKLAFETEKHHKAMAVAREELHRVDELSQMAIAANDDIHCTDYGNCIRFIKKYGRKVLYCPPQDSWYIWNGAGYWKKDSLLEVRKLARDVLINIYNETQFKSDSDKRSIIATWAMKCEKPDHVTSCLRELMSRPTVVVPLEKFDSDKYLFNMQNGTYDLQNHLFAQHDRENFITRQVVYPYDPTHDCPKFKEFLTRIFKSRADKEEIIKYLQKAVGYSLTGDTSKQMIFLLHGVGANGKSTLIEILRRLMGDYGTTISANALTTQKNDSVRNDIARLVNVRLVATSENAKGTTLDEELIKSLTGGDQIAARFLFHEEFVFYPQLKLWWAFNHPPGIRDMTHSLWRRLKMIPFEEIIPEDEQIPQPILLAQFEREISGIFNWALQGLKLFEKEGLKDISAITIAVKEFKDTQDLLYEFLTERCELITQSTLDDKSFVDASIKASEIYTRYVEWASINNEKVMSQKKFSSLLIERGIHKTHSRNGSFFHGIKFKIY